jgi:glucosamine 6-phosphate synthetase-like amidotransferase/phosphosugar isomerase protein
MKELSYIHAEGYPAGEMKTWTERLIDERRPVCSSTRVKPAIARRSYATKRPIRT